VRGADRLHERVLAVHELQLVADLQHGRRREIGARRRDRLNEAAVVAQRFESPALQVRPEVDGSQPFVARAAASTRERIARQELHVGADGGFGDERVGLAGLSQSGRRGRDDQDERHGQQDSGDAVGHGMPIAPRTGPPRQHQRGQRARNVVGFPLPHASI
jgi:hypothetical protein